MKNKRDIIMEKSLELFIERGYTKTRVDDITNSLEISKGSFYTYFSSKENLLLEVIKDIKIKDEECMKDYENKQKKKNIKEIVRDYINLVLDSMIENKHMITLLQEVLANNFFGVEELKDSVINLRQTDVEFVKNNFFKKVKKNFSEEVKGHLADYITCSIHSYSMLRLKQSDDKLTASDRIIMTDEISSMILDGIR